MIVYFSAYWIKKQRDVYFIICISYTYSNILHTVSYKWITRSLFSFSIRIMFYVEFRVLKQNKYQINYTAHHDILNHGFQTRRTIKNLDELICVLFMLLTY